jgi:hypothetical protein
MNDLGKWKVHGPVKTLRKEFATWDPGNESWQPPQYFSLTSFHPEGTISSSDTHNPDGSIAHSRWLYDEAGKLIESNFWMNDAPIKTTVYFYDEAGRHQRTLQLTHDGAQTDLETCTYDAQGIKTKLRFLHFQGNTLGYAIEGSEQFYLAAGAATILTIYGADDLPAKVIFQDAEGRPLREVTFIRDQAGRLLSEETHLESSPFPEGFPAALAKACGETSTKYRYDSRGRVLERSTKFGGLCEARTTYRYSDREEPIEETTEQTNREANLDDEGVLQYSADGVTIQHSRLEYSYDAHGN